MRDNDTNKIYLPLQTESRFGDWFFSIRNDTSLMFSVLLMSSDHPFTRTPFAWLFSRQIVMSHFCPGKPRTHPRPGRMRLYKLINILLLNLMLSAFITSILGTKCPGTIWATCLDFCGSFAQYVVLLVLLVSLYFVLFFSTDCSSSACATCVQTNSACHYCPETKSCFDTTHAGTRVFFS